VVWHGFFTVNAERFIHSVKADRFDYTEWQRDLWKEKTIEKIHASVAAFYEGRHGLTKSVKIWLAISHERIEI